MKPRKSFLLRMDPKLWEELEAWAQQELRSINGQVEFLLKQAVDKRRGRDLPPDSSAEKQSPESLPPETQEPSP